MHVARKLLLILALLVVPMVGMAWTGGAQDQQPGGTGSYLPDAPVKGLPASKYRVVFKSSDCKLDPADSPLVNGLGTGGIGLVPGVKQIAGAILPDISAPDVLCPSVLGKDSLGGATSGAWSAGVYTTSVVTSGVESLLAFDVAAVLRPLVSDVSNRVDDRIVGPLELRHFALAFAALMVGFLFATGRLIRAMGEMIRVAILVGVAALIMSNVAGAYTTMSDLGREATSSALAVAGNDGATKPLDSVREALVWDQWQGQQFGDPLPPACADAAFAALKADKSVIKSVEAAGCPDQAKHAADSSWGRLFAAIAYLILCLSIAWSLFRLAIGVIVGQLALAGSFILAPVACAVAPLRAGRGLFGSWLATLVRLVAGMAFSGLLLSVALLAVQAVLAAPWSPFMRLAGAAVAAFVVGRMSQRWLARFEQRAHHTTTRVVAGGLAAGVGAGAGAVAAQGIVSRAHGRTTAVAAQTTARVRGAATYQATSTAKQVGGKAIAPVTAPIRARRQARHQVAASAQRERVDAIVTKRKAGAAVAAQHKRAARNSLRVRMAKITNRVPHP